MNYQAEIQVLENKFGFEYSGRKTHQAMIFHYWPENSSLAGDRVLHVAATGAGTDEAWRNLVSTLNTLKLKADHDAAMRAAIDAAREQERIDAK